MSQKTKEFTYYKDQTQQERKGCAMIDRIDKLCARIIKCQMIDKHMRLNHILFIHK
jgi:hypothetical protein